MTPTTASAAALARPLNREAIRRPVSPTDPAGPCLRDAGRYDTVQEAARAQFGDPDFGVPEKRPDWPLAEQVSRDALETETKDLYLAVAYAEAAAHARGFEGLADAAWLLRELHATFWDTFHPRPNGPDLHARARVLDLLVRKLGPLLREWGARRSVSPGPTLAAVRADLTACGDLVRSRYGDVAVSMAPLLEPLDEFDAAEPEPKPPPAPSQPAVSTPPATPFSGATASLTTRLASWNGVLREARNQGLPAASPPDPTCRARLEHLFATERWHELLAEVDAALATTQARIWLDLHRYTAGALGQLGGEHADDRRWLLACLGAFLAACPGLVDARFTDGTPVADATTRAWLAAEVLASSVPKAVRPQTGTHTESTAADARRIRHIAERTQAAGLLAEGRPLAAAGCLRRLADELARHDLAHWEGPAFAAATLSLLCQAYDDLASRGVPSATLQDRRFVAHEALAGLAPEQATDSIP